MPFSPTLRRILLTPPTDFLPTGSRALDALLSVVDAVQIVVLFGAFLVFGRKPKDWGR